MPGLIQSPSFSVPKPSKLSTTSCERIVYESFNHAEETAIVVVQSNLSHPKLLAITTGHIMNDNPLCPSSVFADMALTIASYIYKELHPDAPEVGMNVCSVEVHKVLIAQIPPPKDGQHFQMEAHADLKKGSLGEVALTIRSVTWDGKPTQDHGNGKVQFEDRDQWLASFKAKEYLVLGQVASLEAKLAAGTAHKFLRGMAYKLFAALMDYGPKYQGMDDVILDSETKQGVATIRFKSTEADGEFFCSPYFIDNMCHLSGFLVNAADLGEEPLVYISHSWKSMRVVRWPELGRTYRSFVRMVDCGGNVASGDVYVLEGEEIVAVFEECRFQGLPRRLMNVLLLGRKKVEVKAVKGKGKERGEVQSCSGKIEMAWFRV